MTIIGVQNIAGRKIYLTNSNSA